MGRLNSFINPLNKVRPSDHQTYAHELEIAQEHGFNQITEDGGEFWHQAMKAATRNTNNVKSKNRMIQIVNNARNILSI